MESKPDVPNPLEDRFLFVCAVLWLVVTVPLTIYIPLTLGRWEGPLLVVHMIAFACGVFVYEARAHAKNKAQSK